MSRPMRIERAGGWYHLTSRGNERRAIYRDNRDRAHFCEWLGELVARFRVRLHGFVLMDNHDHLIVELTEPNLSRTGQWLNVSCSVWFNRRHGRSGHLFQGRFKSVVVDPSRWGLALSRYVHLNPVRVGRLGFGPTDRQPLRVGAREAPDARTVTERDLVLPIGRRACGLKLGELAAAAGMSDDKAVSAALRRYERRLQRSTSGRELLKQVCQMSKVEM